MMSDQPRPARPATFYERVDEFERQLLADALEQAYGDEREVARALGLSLTALELKLARLGVEYRHAATRPGSPRGMVTELQRRNINLGQQRTATNRALAAARRHQPRTRASSGDT